MILVGTEEWEDFFAEAEIVATFESKDGPALVMAVALDGTPVGVSGGCTLYVSAYVQDPAPSPTIKIGRKTADLMERMGMPGDYVDEVLDVRGTFLEGLKPGEMHTVKWAEAHPSIGSAVLRLAAVMHGQATDRLLVELDTRANLGVLDLLTTPSGI